MATAARKPSAKPRPTARATARKKAAAPKAAAASRAVDAAGRKKVGKTLDVQAFMAQHQRNAASSAAHWETKE
jgi:hypothetical protein